MATIQTSSLMYSAGLSPFYRRSTSRIVTATISAPKIRMNHHLSLPKLPASDLVEDLYLRNGYNIATSSTTQMDKDSSSSRADDVSADPLVIAKFYAIMEAVADRVEMHKNIGGQRDNWNHLFLTSINGITLGAAVMIGLAAATGNGASLLALKISSTILYSAVTGMLVLMNKIQPSQLAEEQRNAARLFKLLNAELQTVLALGNPNTADVDEAMEKVLALDRAYPLPLLGAMLEKFPSRVEPAVWWPQKRRKERLVNGKNSDNNGWDGNLEEEMRRVVDVLRMKDMDDYLRLGKIALQVNTILANSGPLLTGIAAIGSAFVGTNQGSWAVVVGVVAGALACIVNTFEHASQVGMVFEMYRGNAGFFKLMEETIQSNVDEKNVEKRDNGELFELKVALQLGRSLSELRNLASSSGNGEAAVKEFASKLF
ncbi:F-box protein [Melia azedarach]|uniref:F-box protein n=2 Tax=Melia azedarach TaxID=155640 RepID=A0ACC1WY39_MELAZ|nr:F-box protein [Melia azedarach]KAJ4703940.1 F-box protein [Melia azedarach]